MIVLRLINLLRKPCWREKVNGVEHFGLTRDEVVNLQGTSSFVHNLMCNLKKIRRIGGGGGNGLPQSQNTNTRSSSFLQHLDHGRQTATPSLNTQQPQQFLKQRALVTSSPNNNEVSLTQSPAPSNHTPPGSVGQAHVSSAGQLVSIAAFPGGGGPVEQWISMLMLAFSTPKLSDGFQKNLMSDLHFKLSKFVLVLITYCFTCISNSVQPLSLQNSILHKFAHYINYEYY